MTTTTKRTTKQAAKQTTAKKPAKAPRSTKAKSGKAAAKKRGKAQAKRDSKFSALDAAIKVLGEAREPMGCRQMIEAMASKGYWTSPAGKTPHATLYAAILRETQQKGNDSRFKKTDRGRFALAKA
jgi:hypothetical protein